MSALIEFDLATVTLRDKLLISDVSFGLAPGAKAVLQGRSGSGKSTVLKALLGFFPLTRGDIRFQGASLSPRIARTLRTVAAYISQEPILGADTVRAALLLPFQYQAHQQRHPTDLELVQSLETFHLPADLLHQACARISVGEKQRVALARAQLLGKRLYLLDEVTSALDGQSKEPVFALLTDPSLTVLSVAHDPEWIDRCETVLELTDGRLTGEYHRGNA